MINRKLYTLLCLGGLSFLLACGAPDAYENEVDGGVEYGENTQAVGYPKDFDSTEVDPNDSLYIDSDGTYPESMDAERDGDGVDHIEEGLNDTDGQ